MSKRIPYEAEQTSKDLGKRLAQARKRRGWRQEDVCKHTGCSRATIQKMEAGDPTVSFGSYLTLLTLYGAVDSLSEVCKPEDDLGALDREPITQRVRLKHDLDNNF
ncbi:MAG: DNA-binding protein [Neptuniibacter caesariensis]|uniref:DNA-binding protein n=1 Tax=Neptuniibacter caesariensis TaxID=207954 RepID=A0A2G6JNG5_NEPCE|nr:MAG: DNA-binding protein [Neptuniibacter caesariensis]